MRTVALALLLVTVPLAGCANEASGPTIESPTPPTGMRLTYEITANGTTTTDTFMAYTIAEGVRLLAWDLNRANFSSPFVDYDAEFDFRKFNWTDTLEFPLSPGDSYEATVGGASSTVTWKAVEAQTPARDAEKALEGTAVSDQGNTVATFRFVPGDPPLISYIDVETPDGTEQTWRLVDTHPNTNWNDVPTWELGDWWTYNGTFTDFQGQTQMLYLTNESARGASEKYVLSPVDIEDQELSRPLQKWRKKDLAPQSGFVTSIADTFWSWPLQNEKTWTGTASGRTKAAAYQAQSTLEDRIELPDGSYAFGWEIETRNENRKTLAQYTYVPRIEHLTSFQGRLVDQSTLSIDFELVDWGENYQGPVDVPIREALHESSNQGPFQGTETLEVPEPANTISVEGKAVTKDPSSGEVSFTLEDPNGTIQYRRNESGFSDQQLDLNEVLAAQPGNWTFQAEGSKEISYVIQIRANWFETRNVDFS